MHFPKRVILAALLLAVPCAAQTPAALLEKGIYTQETAGDLDGAIQIYRQIVSSTPAQSPTGAQAQYRIADILLQKGDLPGAATEFSILGSRYSENQTLITKMAKRRETLPAIDMNRVANIADGHFRSPRTGVEFSFPSNWKVTYNGASSDDGDIVDLAEPTATIDYAVWMRPEVTPPSKIQDQLRASVPAKVKMNAERQGFAFRPESVQPHTIAGNQALSGIADYVDNGHKMSAYYIWVYTPKTHAMFVAREVPVEALSAAQSHLDQMAASALVP